MTGWESWTPDRLPNTDMRIAITPATLSWRVIDMVTASTPVFSL